MANQYRLIKLPGYFVLSRVNDQVFSFDREHRLFHAWLEGDTFRIGLDGHVVEFRPGGIETFPVCKRLPEKEVRVLFEKVQKELKEIAQAPNDAFLLEMEDFLSGEKAKPEIHRMAQKLSPQELEQEHREFENVYGSVPILPPDCYGSLLIQVTRGCSYNQCRFCTLYGDREFEVLSDEKLSQHIQKVLEFQRGALDRWNSIFLGEANALCLDHNLLIQKIELIQDAFKRTSNAKASQTLYSFDDASAPKRTSTQFKELHARGLKRVYIGLETGEWKLRKGLLKPGDETSFRKKIEGLKEANISVGIILLAGVGGREHEDSHMEASTELLKSLSLDMEDYVYISPLRVKKDSTYPLWEKEQDFSPLDDEETWDQAFLLMDRIADACKGRNRPKIAIYDLDRFVY